jgi:hypothetical protein
VSLARITSPAVVAPLGADAFAAAYRAFLQRKAQVATRDGFAPIWVPDFLYDFQQALVEWMLYQGRGAIFADCGLGKGPMELVVGENWRRHTNRPVLVLAPLAVSIQLVAEAEKFGVPARRSQDGAAHRDALTVTNYERLHLFDPADFAGIILDESSILKAFDGDTRRRITEFARRMRYRMFSTATAAPNDYLELGTHSEALGYLGHMDMLRRFFKNDQGKGAAARRSYGKSVEWRLRRHAEDAFWRWVCSWARAVRRPSDLGFADGGFVLPPLIEREHVVDAPEAPEGMLFALPAVTRQEQQEETRRTLRARCARAAELAGHDDFAVLWANLNDEADLLERLLPGAVQVAGRMRDEEKEEILNAFSRGEIRKLVTKDSITGFGLNWQHCCRTVVFPTHSFEKYYQLVRRFLRFGQARAVEVDIVIPEGNRGILQNVRKKAERADAMFARLVALMNDAMAVDHRTEFPLQTELPRWL